jgi:uncharacterized protein YndB with AHSA1/START domain
MGTTHMHIAGLIGAAPEVVWEALADHDSWPQWYVHPDGAAGLSRVEVLETVPGGVGTRRRCTFVAGGQEQATWEELIVEWRPGQILSYVGICADAPVHWWRARVTLTPNGSSGRSTLVEWQTSYEPRGWLGLLLDTLVLRRTLAACMEHGIQQLDVRLSGAASPAEVPTTGGTAPASTPETAAPVAVASAAAVAEGGAG